MSDLSWLGQLGETLFTVPGWNGGTVEELERYLYSQGMTSEKTDEDGLKSFPNWLYRTDDNGVLNLNTTLYDGYGNALTAEQANEMLKNGQASQIFFTPTQGKIRVSAEKKIKGMLAAFGLKVKDGAAWILDNLIENMGYDKARGTWLDITRTGDKAVTTANKKDFEKLKDLLKKNHLLGEDTGTSFVSGNWSLPLSIKHVAAYQNDVAEDLVNNVFEIARKAGYFNYTNISATEIKNIALGKDVSQENMTDDEKNNLDHLGLFSIFISPGQSLRYGEEEEETAKANHPKIYAYYCFNNLDYDYGIEAAENKYIAEGIYLFAKRQNDALYMKSGRNMFLVTYEYDNSTGKYNNYTSITDNPYIYLRMGGTATSINCEVGAIQYDSKGKITGKIKRDNGDIVDYTKFEGLAFISLIGSENSGFTATDYNSNNRFLALATATVGYIFGLENIFPEEGYPRIFQDMIGKTAEEAVISTLPYGESNNGTAGGGVGFMYGTRVTAVKNGININLEKTDADAKVVDPDKSLEEQYQGWTESGQAVVETYPRDDALTQDKNIALPFPMAEDATQAVAQEGTKVYDYAKAQEDAAGAVAVDRAAATDAAAVIDGVLVDPTIQPVIPGGKVEITTPTGTGAGGLWSIYNPTVSQIQRFGKWLWEDPIEGLTQPGDTLKKLFQNPMDAIISLHKVYVTPTTGASQNIKVGYLDSGVSSKTVTNRYVTKGLGSVTINPLNGNFMDFDGVELTIFLPFIGMRSLDTSVCMGATLSLSYRIDILTGAIVASLTVNKNNISGVVYQWVGNMLESVPLTSSNFSQAVNAVIGLVGSAVTTIGTGGATAPMLAGAGINALGSAGTSIQNCGSIGGNAGALASKTPYIVYSIVQTYNPYNWRHIKGLPDNVTQTVGSQSGYIEADEITGTTTMTDEEFRDCKNMFSDGIFIN